MRRDYKGISINTSKNTHETVFTLLDNDRDAVIVDIPCGSGAFVRRLKDQGFTNIVAADIINLMEIEHEHFITADMEQKLPLADDSCDAVVCIDGIEHISRQFDFAGEVCRILRKGGTFIISTPNVSSIRSRWKFFVTGHHHKCTSPLDENNPNPLHHIGMISFPELRYLLHTRQFKIDTVTTNRIKAVSWLFLLFIPLVYPVSFLTYRRTGREKGTLGLNREVMRTMFSREVLLGESLIVRARKISPADS
ncbi:MAG: class I SAM-dependent methyltransferase [Bacteroidales bacterium]|nr:class I SAM-dependent methyltransferase [Bacteroidales bacterium]